MVVAKDDSAKNYDYFAKATRLESYVVCVIVSFLSLLTLYFAMINAYVLRNAIPAPYRLTFDVPSAGAEASYAAVVSWRADPGSARIVRPIVTLDGQTVPDNQAAGRVEVRLRKSHEIRVDVPMNSAAGRHEGQLVLTRISGPTDLEPSLTLPLRVDVEASLWNNWFILRNWLGVTAGVSALLYVVCIAFFPAPAGTIILRDDAEKKRVRRLRVPLRVRTIAWLFPWWRSTVPLSWVWRRAGIGSRPPFGSLVFYTSDLPILIGAKCPARATLKIGNSAYPLGDIECSAERPVGAVEVVFQEKCFEYREDPAHPPVHLAFRRRRLAVPNSPVGRRRPKERS